LTVAGVATCGLLAVQLGTGAPSEIGVIVRLGLMFALILYGSRKVAPSGRALAWSLAVLPLARLLAIGLPLDVLPPLYQIVAIGLPVVIAATTAAWAIGYSWRDLGVRVTWRSLASVLALAPLGWGIGTDQQAAGIGAPVAASLSFDDLWLPVGLVVLSSSVADELLYRGVLQRAATSLFGWSGLIWSSAIYTVAHVGQVPAGELTTVFILGLTFAVCTRLTGSILGAVVGHATYDVAASVVGPLH
jgi:hypothetical protein